jgi:hypothetical protein
MKIRLILLLSITFLIVVFVTAFFLSQVGTETITPIENTEVEEVTPIVSGDRDEHGCIGSAGYSWCEEKQKCLRTWEEPCTETE